MKHRPRAAGARLGWAGLLVLGAVGCQDAWLTGSHMYVKPTLSVLPFEDTNRMRQTPQWDVAHGMSQMLIEALGETDRFTVVEPGRVAASEGTALAGTSRLRPRYRVRAIVHEFGHFSRDVDFWQRLGGKTGHEAVVSVTFILEDSTQPDTILLREKLEHSVQVSEDQPLDVYEGTSFGSITFRQTPLGKATTAILKAAVELIAEHIGQQLWEPRIAKVQPEGLILVNGGRDRQLKAGWRFEVLEEGSEVIDPETGQSLGRTDPKVVAEVEVLRVEDRYSMARILRGGPVTIAQKLRRLD